MKNFKKTYLRLRPIFLGLEVFAQEKDKSLPLANEEYADNKFVDAEANYRVSNSKFPNRTVASYNLGNAIYKQNQASEAKFAYAEAIKTLNQDLKT
jgi:TolA-binding protein